MASALPEIRPCLERWDRGWPSTWMVTGDDGSGGRWKHPRLWRFFIAWLGHCNRCREYQERIVLAGDGEEASVRMLKGVVADATEGEFVACVELYHVIEPLTPEAVRWIEELNRYLEILKGQEHESAIRNPQSAIGRPQRSGPGRLGRGDDAGHGDPGSRRQCAVCVQG